ncbi:MAG TPA: hypothetical protein DEP69_01655, partial [Acidimicrobiaceae bacterium]|nr:hypothetical protein [Acidimicrobiaceae bacterium]
MIRRARIVAACLLVAFALLFVQLNIVVLLRADALADVPANVREIARSYGTARGAVVTADGVVVAESPASPPAAGAAPRSYPHGELYAEVVGYLSATHGASGLERRFNAQLAGADPDVGVRRLSDLLVDRRNVGTLATTLRHDLQQAAAAALGGRAGAVVVVDPTTGDVVALVGRPTFDPSLAAAEPGGPDGAGYFAALAADPARPLVSAATQRAYELGDWPERVVGRQPGIYARPEVTLFPATLTDTGSAGSRSSLTVLELALLTAAVAQDGVRMQPRFVTAVVDGDVPSGAGPAGSGADPLVVYPSSPMTPPFDRTAARELAASMTAAGGTGTSLAVAWGSATPAGPAGAGVPAAGWAAAFALEADPAFAVAVVLDPSSGTAPGTA